MKRNSPQSMRESINSYESSARTLTLGSMGSFVVGAVFTGVSAYAGAKGHDTDFGIDTGIAALNYAAGVLNLNNGNRNAQRAAALRAALAQHELTASQTDTTH